MAYKASFKTGWNQREIHADMKVKNAGKVGYLYSINGDTLELLATAPSAGTKYAMLAQSDDSLGNSNIPVENRDYRYSDEVVASASVKKHVAYFIVDTNDITWNTVV